MGVHATESKLLVAGLAWLLEGVSSKLSVITVILLDADTMLGCKLLKHLLGKDGLCGRVVKLKVHKTQSGVVVYKNSTVSVLLLCECPLQLEKSPPLLIAFGWLRLSPPAWQQQRLHEKVPTICHAKVAWSSHQIVSQHTEGGLSFDNFLGILPLMVSCFSLWKKRWHKQ